MDKVIQLLIDTNSCQESIDYVNSFSTFREVWDNCAEAVWILSLAGKSGAYNRIELTQIVLDYIQFIGKDLFAMHPDARVLRTFNALTDENWIHDLCVVFFEMQEEWAADYLRAVLSYDRICEAL